MDKVIAGLSTCVSLYGAAVIAETLESFAHSPITRAVENFR
jgi:hypothetical protein